MQEVDLPRYVSVYANTVHMAFSRESKYKAMVYNDVETIELSIIESNSPTQRL